MIEYLGWAATAVFASSYFWSPEAGKRIQMLGALIWIAYGVLLGASPVIVANVLVFAAAAWTLAGPSVTAARSGERGALPQSDPPTLR